MDHKSDKDLLEKMINEKNAPWIKRLLVVGGTGFLGKHILKKGVQLGFKSQYFIKDS